MFKSLQLSDDYVMRNYFVTNSSSTSYVGFGVVLSTSDVIGDEVINNTSNYEEIQAALHKAFEGFDVGASIESWEDRDPPLFVYVKESFQYTRDGGFGELGLLDEIPDADEVGRWLDSQDMGYLKEKIGWVFASYVDQHGGIK